MLTTLARRLFQKVETNSSKRSLLTSTHFRPLDAFDSSCLSSPDDGGELR
jgi:hypothetical protein